MLSPTETLDRLLTPKDALAYLKERYGVVISIASFYSMISRGQAPKVSYFKNRPRFTASDIDEWVRKNLSATRK
jgi:predicted DNA-binding transcriptional regulator AlpA